MSPGVRNIDGGKGKLITPTDNSKTFIYYDYNDGSWKFQIEEISGAGNRYDTVKMIYDRGTYNIINSVVPRDGYNTGRGQRLDLRYANNSAGDFYPVLPTIEYRDGDTDFVDDYSATFSVNMVGQYGNGVITVGTDYIKYKEAYLFNERDDLFSALYLTNAFEKNPLTAFYIAWTILAPLG